MKTVLAIDGGGIKGLIPAMLLGDIQRRMGRDLARVFDLAVGTSTGGIIALAVASGIDVHQVEGLYRHMGPVIFRRNRWSAAGLLGPRYRADGIERVLAEQFGEQLLGNTLLPVAVTAMRVADNRSDVISSWADADMLTRDAARATSAAPTFFPAAPSGHWDGGCWGNNPAGVAYLEAEMLWPNDEIRVLSLGCGVRSSTQSVAERMHGGLLRLAPMLPSLLMGGGVDFVERQMRRRGPRRYLRVDPDLNGASAAMDDVSAANVQELTYVGRAAIDDNAGEVVAWLKEAA